MADYDNNMAGVLFKNERKAKDTDPDYTGNCEINHEEMWLSAWIKTSGKGKKFLKLSFRPKQDGGGQGGGGGASVVTPQTQTTVPASLPDDDIPF